jgi:hypothetical protein
VTTPAQLLSDALRRDGARPFLTYYDLASGDRVELSVATTANWVAKTANLLVDEYDVDLGDRVTVWLPVHWQAAVVVLASWSAGAEVSFDSGGRVTFTTPDRPVDGAVVLTSSPMGIALSRLVAAQPDSFEPIAAGGAGLVEAATIDLAPNARVLTVLPYRMPRSLIDGLLAPLAVGGSVVIVAHAESGDLEVPARAENVSHTLGASLRDLPRLDG